MCHDEIENILDSDHRELIGDYSKVLAVGSLRRLDPLLTVAPEPSSFFSNSLSPQRPLALSFASYPLFSSRLLSLSLSLIA